MTSLTHLLSLALLYVSLLFAVAWWFDRRSQMGASVRDVRLRPWVYALSLGVYCSSWTFYGAVGSSTAQPWSHAPVYLGPILLCLFGWPILARLVRLGVRHRVTSIADYLGARYGKRQSLSMLVTAVATAAVLPYIGLQFRALDQAWAVMVADRGTPPADTGGDTTLLIAVLLAAFTLLFGTRRLDGRERHPGVMNAIAVESLVKLLAFIAVAVFALVKLGAVALPAEAPPAFPLPEASLFSAEFLAHTLLSALAILCLPRQFHVIVVEVQQFADARLMRWVFPAYLAVFMLLAVPISSLGSAVQAGGASGLPSPDVFIQWLPLAYDADWLALAVFIGGISAATGMVIVATVSLAIMITNEIAVPALLQLRGDSSELILRLGENLRRVRQLTIVGILLAAWWVARWLDGIPWLSDIGFISFLAAAQLAPGLLAGLYWRRAQGVAVMAGLLLGLLLWLLLAALPAILPGLAGLAGAETVDTAMARALPASLAFATLISLGGNTLLMVLLSLLLRPSAADLRQAHAFLDEDSPVPSGDSVESLTLSPVRIGQLQALLLPFISEDAYQRLWRELEDRYQQRLLIADRAPRFVVQQVESLLAGVIGSASARRVLQQLEDSRQLAFSDLATLIGDANQQYSFNRELLESTVESMLQGVSVVDSDLRLVAWNSRYEQMFEYPPRFLYVGCPIERVYRFNAQRGILGGSEASDDQIARRLAWLRQGSPHRLQRRMPNGRVIDIRGNTMPNGGFVTTFIDVTDYREMVAELEDAKQELEARVESGSRSLSESNAELRRENRLRSAAESRLREANLSRSRFMSATSHDLLQPINAARLFLTSLRSRSDGREELTPTINQIDDALQRAEQLIAELREMARLDAGRQQPQPEHFAAAPLLLQLADEFGPAAHRANVRLRCRPGSLWLYSDRALVYRILQNLLGNAIKYAAPGDVLLGLRRRPGGAELQVVDCGPGISPQDQVRIFDEFERLDGSSRDDEGLGLGLAIVRRYAELLDLPLRLTSQPGRGTLFSVTLPRGDVQLELTTATHDARTDLSGARILCLENDARVRTAMLSMLTSFGCRVRAVADRQGLHDALMQEPADVVLADYHLDAGDTGLAALLAVLPALEGPRPDVVIISADDGTDTRLTVQAAGYRFLPKPVNPSRLRALLRALLDARASAGAINGPQ